MVEMHLHPENQAPRRDPKGSELPPAAVEMVEMEMMILLARLFLPTPAPLSTPPLFYSSSPSPPLSTPPTVLFFISISISS
jgi:hypothetical protein